MPKLPYPRIFISALKKSSGKTLVTLGLAAAFREAGKEVRLYKKGPDYIDPMWHKAASRHESYNLDQFLMSDNYCRKSFLQRSHNFDISIIEGNHGLHDSLDLEGNFSSAALSKLLKAPVILVLDSRGMNRNIAAVVMGLQMFDPDVSTRGVILNNVVSNRHERKLVNAIEKYCGIPVLGTIPLLDRPVIEERHLGLITTKEEENAQTIIATLRRIILENVNISRILEIASTASHLEYDPVPAGRKSEPKITIGVAYDPAFCFYYPENLESLESAGAELIYFNSLSAPLLPKVDALYIAGGFPEIFLDELENNASLREDIRSKIEGGMPVYAECGGLLYLARTISINGHTSNMVGVIKADVQFQSSPAGHGYVELSRKGKGWLDLKRSIRGHEFHYSKLTNIDPSMEFMFELQKGEGAGEGRDGIIYKNLLASYTHLHHGSVPEWSRSFVDFVYEHINS